MTFGFLNDDEKPSIKTPKEALMLSPVLDYQTQPVMGL